MKNLNPIPKYRKRLVISSVTFCLGIFVFFSGWRVGLKQASSKYFTLKDGVLYTEENIGMPIDDFSAVSQIFQSITVHGVEVSGKIISVSVEDVVKIVTAINKIDNAEPILLITVLSETHVEVTTGVVQDPLTGGGKIYSVKKVNGEWIIDYEDTSKWVS